MFKAGLFTVVGGLVVCIIISISTFQDFLKFMYILQYCTARYIVFFLSLFSFSLFLIKFSIKDKLKKISHKIFPNFYQKVYLSRRTFKHQFICSACLLACMFVSLSNKRRNGGGLGQDFFVVSHIIPGKVYNYCRLKFKKFS